MLTGIINVIAYTEMIILLFERKSYYVNWCMVKMFRYEHFTPIYEIIAKWIK